MEEIQIYDDLVNLTLLPADMMFNETHLIVIWCYSIVFIFAALGNITMLLILLRNLKRAKLNRVYTLLLNLNVADLIVTFFHMPKEIVHSATVQWYGPDWLCRLSKYLDVFGIYLSSNVLICLSIDRFFAIVRPLYSFTAGRRVKIMLVLSWILAAASSLPQVYTFCKATHPAFPWYSQCIALPVECGTGNSTQYVLFNTALNALEIYILPFLVIVFCYGAILVNMLNEFRSGNEAQISASSGKVTKMSLRRSSNCYIRRAKSKTLRMTIVIVITFLVCWTPYFVMVSLHFTDMNLATGDRYFNIDIPPVVEKFLYIFAIFNSCLNPFLYGYFSFKLKSELDALLDFICYYCCCAYCWCPNKKLRMQECRRRHVRPLPQRVSTMRKSAKRDRGLSLDFGMTGPGCASASGGGHELTMVVLEEENENGPGMVSTAAMIAANSLAFSNCHSPHGRVRKKMETGRNVMKRKNDGGRQHIQKLPLLLVNDQWMENSDVRVGSYESITGQ